jgi:hypothetical protein
MQHRSNQSSEETLQDLLEFEMKRSSTYWNCIMGNRSSNDLKHNPIHKETEKKINKLKKAERQLEQLENVVKSNLYEL